ncbi:hypothetical protein PF008_g17389 [Phytophthora fragariae]|uniref:Uncharacterized protein n=1 Tax=Phytophthora fragariae TaxID=53985 RepID=A0A6G0R8V8_9STRA|nr:hypothetical protein PF008_g17389 [Phytophthora fragariae]
MDDAEHAESSTAPMTMSESTAESTSTAVTPRMATSDGITAVMSLNDHTATNDESLNDHTATESGGTRKWKRVTFADPLVDGKERAEARYEGQDAVHAAVTGVTNAAEVTSTVDATKATQDMRTRKPGKTTITTTRASSRRSTRTTSEKPPGAAKTDTATNRAASAVATTSKRAKPTPRQGADEQRDDGDDNGGRRVAKKQRGSRSDGEQREHEPPCMY